MNTPSKIALIGTIALLAACGRSEPGRVQGGAAAGPPRARPSVWWADRLASLRAR